MRQYLIDMLSPESEEERSLLEGAEIDRQRYSSGEEFVINGARLGRGDGIGVRTHTRYTDFPRHRHNYVEMMIVLDGSITHDFGSEKVALSAGEILIMNKHVSHSVMRAEKQDLGVNVIMSDAFVGAVAPELAGTVFSALFNENSRADGTPVYLVLSSAKEKKHGNLVENLLFELTRESGSRKIMEKTVALLLLCLSEDDSLIIGGSSQRSREDKRIIKIKSYVKNNYRCPSLVELSKKTYLSVPYLSKFIKERLGMSFVELVREERLSRAMDLILNTGMPIGEIIRAVGYENESYFHRVFRERYGSTPLSVRKANGNNPHKTAKIE